MAEDLMHVLGVDSFVTMRSFTVELQTYIEQETTAELHTVTVRNVVELGFRCDICQEALKTFDSLTAHWKSAICETADIVTPADAPLNSPVQNTLPDTVASEVLDISDTEMEGDIEPACNIEIDDGIKEQTQNNPVDKDFILMQQPHSVDSVLLAEHTISTQTHVSQGVDQNAENATDKSIEFNNVGNAITVLNRPTEESNQNVNAMYNERSEQSISQEISKIQDNSVDKEGVATALLRCVICNEVVARDALEEHIVQHMMMKCSQCEDVFKSEALLKEHSKTHNGEKVHQCTICDKIYVQKSSLKLHMLKHTGCLPHKCVVCEKSFAAKSDLSRHETRHGKIKPYQCSDCGKSFADKSYLALHLKRHKEEILHTCEICEMNFTTKSQLTMHSRKHTGERPYGCSHCNQTFANQTSLKYHEARHTGLRPFVCEVCQATFISKNALSVHSRVHSGEKPYKCEICGKSFARNSLKLHMRYHTGEKPFPCDVCGNRFVTRTHLATHMRCHSGEKPFSCDRCDKSFGHKSSLVYHLRSHTGEKPFACPLCEKRFMDTNTMKRHAITCAIKRLGKNNAVVKMETETNDPSRSPSI